MGGRLKRIREAAGLSQTKLAALAKVPVMSLRNWEQDKRIPRLDVAAQLAVAMGVSLDVIAGIKDSD